MLSLATGKLVNRDQFTIMPILESVIKRMNALALADGMVKCKGELEKINSTFEQLDDKADELPKMMETRVNEGVDPSTAITDTNYSLEFVYEELVEHADVAQPEEQHIEETMYADDMVPPATPTVGVRVEPRVVDSDDMMSSFTKLAEGTPDTAPHETSDEQDVPEDYGENGAIDTGVLEEPVAPTVSPTTYSAYGHRVVSRGNLMDMFRSDKNGTALLTRNYDFAGGD